MKKLLFFVGLCMSIGWSADLYIFAPNFSKPNVIEKEIGAKIPSATVKAFGRFNDFKAIVGSTKPSILIAPSETIRALGIQERGRLQGLIGGQTSESMVLVSIGTKAEISQINGQAVGVVATLDRTELKGFLETTLKSKPKLNAVTKLEDLIPMLTFQSAVAVMVTNSQAVEFKKRSQANLVTSVIPDVKYENLVAVLISDDGKAAFTELEKMPKTLLDLLNVEGWKK
jgi:hypothetical protein